MVQTTNHYIYSIYIYMLTPLVMVSNRLYIYMIISFQSISNQSNQPVFYPMIVPLILPMSEECRMVTPKNSPWENPSRDDSNVLNKPQ